MTDLRSTLLKLVPRRLIHGEEGQVGLLDLVVGVGIILGGVYGYEPATQWIDQQGAPSEHVQPSGGSNSTMDVLRKARFSPEALMEEMLGPVTAYEEEMLSQVP